MPSILQNQYVLAVHDVRRSAEQRPLVSDHRDDADAVQGDHRQRDGVVAREHETRGAGDLAREAGLSCGSRARMALRRAVRLSKTVAAPLSSYERQSRWEATGAGNGAPRSPCLNRSDASRKAPTKAAQIS